MKSIQVERLSKTFQFKTQSGLKGFFHPETRHVQAVSDISFSVEQGESLAFIGPNGAGKSTTIKMLTGILQPTAGEVTVLGKSPLHQRRELVQDIGIVFGQRSQLIFNLPLTESFTLAAGMYRVPPATAARRIAALVEQFDLGPFVEQPVRKLSLGQRMRAEVANALIHQPKIIFLDEPTIGLDIVAKRALREAIRNVNKEQGATIFLTSHDVGDIEEVSDRTMIINHGQIMLDATMDQLKTDYLTIKTVSVIPTGKLPKQAVVAGLPAEIEAGRLVFRVDSTKLSLNEFIPQLMKHMEVADITIADTPLEDVIHNLYTRSKDGHDRP